MSGDVFRAGDPVELIQLDAKAQPYLFKLQEKGTVNVRGQRIPHQALAGHPVGTAIVSEQGQTFFPVRPTLARWVESMPRFAKTIWPNPESQVYQAATKIYRQRFDMNIDSNSG